jgi:hypothetical protein
MLYTRFLTFGFNRILVPKSVEEELKEDGVFGFRHIKELLEEVF